MSVVKIRPSTRKKGYDDLSSQEPLQPDVTGLQERITRVADTAGAKRLSYTDSHYFLLVKKSYERLISGQELLDDEFVLSGHEIREVQTISDNHLPRYLVYRYKYNKFPALKIVEDYPPCVQIEPTSICNYRCVMCYQVDKSFSGRSMGHMGHMGLNVFKQAIDELEGNVEAVTLASRGEPTLNPHLPEMLEYATGKFLGLKLNTNASVLTEPLIHAILQSDLRTLVFSADAADKNTYEKIRVNGKFDRVMRNIQLFHDIKSTHYKDNPLVTRVSGVKLNDDQNISDMEKAWGSLVNEVAFVHYNPWESAYNNDENSLISPCTELFRRVFLWWDGRFNPCDYDYKSTLTELDRETFPEISIQEFWQGNLYSLLREKHLSKKRCDFEPCKRCVAL